tara:strand:+ start:50 stop:1399 length:1350 start_codon:yes stop_codon:yes gene_type:complete
MFKKVLVANRGEIALRVIRACRELNINTVAVYSKADDLSIHVKYADEAICIGPADSAKSYLNIPSIIAAAELTNADAIHPGYGFLSENSDFSSICNDNNIIFIGPDAQTIDAMGNKSKAKETMKNLGVPVIPGSDGIVESVEEGLKVANEIGYPVLIKASSGGGGRGMRLVNSEDEFKSNYDSAKSEAKIAFNDDNVYLEKYFTNPKHIEIQVIGDNYGNAYSLFERECSLQRRHQKILEESPSLALNDDMRREISDLSVHITKSIKYNGVGTIEYIYDINTSKYYFMEMNTRIQVEHPVTEMITNYDLVRNQILCHANVELSKSLENININGHSIECRINAEDPNNNFMPSPGEITSFHLPGGIGVRVDTHAYAGYKVPSNYDSMIAKIIVHADTRKEAINRMLGALNECVIEGIYTTIPLHINILQNNDFINGDFDTNFLNKIIEDK